MKQYLLRPIIALLLTSMGAGVLAADALPISTIAPVNIIFDTDMGGDCDDVGALFILHGAVERGEARLLATMGCVSADAIGPAMDAINIWFGRPEIPVGTLTRHYPAPPGTTRHLTRFLRGAVKTQFLAVKPIIAVFTA